MKRNGNRLLLIAPAFFDYEHKIIEELGALNYTVKYINADPNGLLGTIYSSFKKIHFGTDFIIKCFENVIYKKVKNESFDKVLVICGWALTSRVISRIRNNCLSERGKMYLYYWDSIHLLKDDQKRLVFFDEVFSFDEIDCKKSNGRIQFLPLFYCNDFDVTNKDNSEYHLATIGSYKYDRYFMIENLKKRFPEIRILSYLYTPKWMILFHKLLRKKYKDIKLENLSFKKLSFGDIISLYSKCEAVLDIPRTGQDGLTMRTFECLAMHKKILTTNTNIKKYDFYNPDNCYVINNEMTQFPDKDWFEKPYKEIDRTIVEQYSISHWLRVIIED